MIDITQALVTLIRQNVDIESITSGNVISDQLPQEVPIPAVVLWVQSGRAHDTLDGGPLGMDQPVFRIECYAEKRIDASDLRLKVRDHIVATHGVYDGVFIKGIAQDDGQRQRTDRVRSGTDEYRFVAAQDFRVSYNSIDIPIISQQPEDQTVIEGETATFTVVADATSYQWQIDDQMGGGFVNIDGATAASYTTPPTVLAENGFQFRCIVSTASGSVTSNAATLTVEPVPPPP